MLEIEEEEDPPKKPSVFKYLTGLVHGWLGHPTKAAEEEKLNEKDQAKKSMVLLRAAIEKDVSLHKNVINDSSTKFYVKIDFTISSY